MIINYSLICEVEGDLPRLINHELSCTMHLDSWMAPDI